MNLRLKTTPLSLSFLFFIIFFIINYIVLKNEMNLAELIMAIIIAFDSINTLYKHHDYLNPRMYFPILYFAIYWLGNFDFTLYDKVPKNIWWIYLIGLLGFYIGGFFAEKFVSIKPYPKKIKDYFSSNARFVLITIYAVCACAKIYIYFKNGIPLFASNIDASREAMSENFGIFKVMAQALTVFPVFFFYEIISRKKAGKKVPIINFFLITLSFIFTILDVSRIPIIQMVVPMILIYILKVHRLSMKSILIAGVILVFFIGINQIMRNIRLNPEYLSYVAKTRGTNMFQNILISCFNNFRVGVDDFYKLVQIVPQKESYTNGRMFINSILSVLPGKQITMGYYVANLLGLSFDGIGAATTILGMFYLDGGIITVFLGMSLFGAFIQSFYQKYILKNTLSIHHLIAVYIIFYSINALRTNVMPTIEPLLTMFYYWSIGMLISRIK